MEKDWLVAFSDGVIAIIITIMVLELKVPHDATLDALVAVTPAFLSYALSFVYVAIHWNNHHHFFHLVRHVSGMMLWANMHPLFWLFVGSFRHRLDGGESFCAGPNRRVWRWAAEAGDRMVRAAASNHPHARQRIRAGAGDRSRPQGQGFACALCRRILFSFLDTRIADAIYVLVALMWLIPDRRIERAIRRL